MAKCVSCGEVVPEGRQVCPICEAKARRLDNQFVKQHIIDPKQHKQPTVELSFGESAPNFLITYYRSRPLNKFQIWMFQRCFGITAKNLRKD